MPRWVVPIAVAALEDSRSASSSRCSGRISVTFSATRRLSGLMATPWPLQFRDLVEKGLRIEHHAVADHGEFRRPQHAGRQQRQFVGLAVDDERMAGIVAALEAHDDVGLLRQPVDDLALPLVAPLGADDDNIGHF